MSEVFSERFWEVLHIIERLREFFVDPVSDLRISESGLVMFGEPLDCGVFGKFFIVHKKALL